MSPASHLAGREVDEASDGEPLRREDPRYPSKERIERTLAHLVGSAERGDVVVFVRCGNGHGSYLGSFDIRVRTFRMKDGGANVKLGFALKC